MKVELTNEEFSDLLYFLSVCQETCQPDELARKAADLRSRLLSEQELR